MWRLEKLMLQADALKKSYGKLVAVNCVSLRAGAGESRTNLRNRILSGRAATAVYKTRGSTVISC